MFLVKGGFGWEDFEVRYLRANAPAKTKIAMIKDTI